MCLHVCLFVLDNFSLVCIDVTITREEIQILSDTIKAVRILSVTTVSNCHLRGLVTLLPRVCCYYQFYDLGLLRQGIEPDLPHERGMFYHRIHRGC